MPALTLRNTDQCYWHLLFPLGGREQVSRGTSGSVMVQEFDAAWCGGMVRSFGEYMAQSGKMGAQPQPRPVSVDHAIVHTLLGKEVEVDAGRVAEVCALHVLESGREGAPAGVYGLIQWSRFGFEQDARPYLSPTTKATMTMRDGTKIAGPFLFEVGLVSLPALDTIGSVYERLALEALPLPDYVRTPAAGVVPDAPMTLRIATTSPDLIMRGATYIEEPPMELSPEMMAKIDEMLGAKIADAEERMYKRACDAMDERMKMREVASPTMPEPAEEPEDDDDAPEAVDPVEEPLAMRALKLAKAAAEQEALELIQSRRLLAKDVDTFVTRRLSGDDAAGLLGDFASLAKPQGHASTAPEGNADAKVVSEAAILEEATLRSFGGGDLNEHFSTIRADYVTRGYTVEA